MYVEKWMKTMEKNKMHFCHKTNSMSVWKKQTFCLSEGGGRLKPPPYLYASLVFLTMVGSLFTNMVGSLFTKTLDKSKEC